MDSPRWTKVSLHGIPHFIPAVCPNCLQPADVSLRCSHGPFIDNMFNPLLANSQTFEYCSTCVDAARAALVCQRVRRGVFWIMSLIPLSLVFVGFMHLVLGEHSPLRPYWMRFVKASGVWSILVFPIGGMLVAWLIVRLTRWRMMRRYPLNEQQAVWGLAAYYKGSGKYSAARPEWLVALVEANPEGVDDATYREVTGCDRPDVETDT